MSVQKSKQQKTVCQTAITASMRRMGCPLLLLILLSSLPSLANLSEVRTYPSEAYDFDLIGQYYNTTSNFSSAGGSYNALPFGDSLQEIIGDGVVRYTMSKTKWAIYADAQVAQTTAKANTITNTSAGFSHLKFGTDFVIVDGAFALIPEFYGILPITTIDLTQTNAAIDEGVDQIAAQLRAQMKVGSFFLGGYGGYVYRDKGRSSLVPYGGFVQMNLKGWNFGGKISGFTSLTQDQDTTNQLPRSLWQLNADGGSQLFGAVNPQLLNVDAWAEFQMSSNISLSVGGGSAINGSNAANGYTLRGALTFRVDPNKRKRELLKQEFREDLGDGVDQSLFRPEPEIRIQPVGAPQTRPAKAKSNVDDSEMKMEIKPRKKSNSNTDLDQ